MEKRALIAIVLSFFVLYVYQSYFIPVPPEMELQRAAEGEGKEVKEKSEIKTSSTGISSELSTSGGKGAIISKTEVLEIEEPEEYKYEGRLYSAVLSSRGGGGLKSLKLLDYREAMDESSPSVQRIRLKDNDYLPLSVSFIGDGTNISDDKVFSVKEKGSDSVEYKSTTSDGLTIIKRYLMYPDEYRMDIDIIVRNDGRKDIDGSLGISLYERFEGELKDRLDIRRQASKIGDDLERTDFEDFKENGVGKKGDVKWVAIENKYFINAIVPKEDHQLKVTNRLIETGVVASTLEKEGISLTPGSQDLLSLSFYSGPKDIYHLKKMGRGLEEAIDLGWFHAIAEPLLRFLKFIYSFTGNYGYAIILVTLIIKLVFFPLANKSYKSMKAMQKLQPHMTELREKYKDDKERMSREVMELYKKHRVNPLSGCLPMVVQIPVFIALYNVLMNAIELRHAPFHLWIVDMSAKDPYYVTPLVMGATMFLQQKMSPSAPDPTQQKVMMMMPVIFTFMFINLPSGLVLYWVVNNVLSIGQQYYILKK